MVQIGDQGVPFAPDESDPKDRTAPRVEILDQKPGGFFVRVDSGNDPEERLRVELGNGFPARTEESVLDPAPEDGLGLDDGQHGRGQPGFIEASVEFDDHANLLVGELLGQDL